MGVAWLRRICGRCRFCRRGRENLCESPRFTGWDEDGGYAEMCLVDEEFAYRIPTPYDDQHAAPLLCSGIIGYRALRVAQLPAAGRLGIYGFGASAHLTMQLALSELDLHVETQAYPFAKADEALRDLAAGRVTGAAVLAIGSGGT